MMKTEDKGITVKKSENFSEWYTQVITKAELIEYTGVSGCMVLRPYSYEIWEKIKDFFDKEIKKLGVKNAYFPLLIPESLLTKEKEHVKGFSPEVAWVTHAGNSKLSERLAIRPTSETIMYDTYKKWIRSYQDLPLLINQWCNVVRWEFKHPVPFLRTREFLWQEGHTAHATKEGADTEVLIILDRYTKVFEELLAVPVLKGLKSEKEKFAGADYTTSVETIFPDGKAIQGGTSHALGQNFSKSFGITFTDEKEKRQHVWQNSWGFSTRSIGIMLAIHGDDKGLIMPPRVAPIQAVIVPIIFDKTKKEVLEKSNEIKGKLKNFLVELDAGENYSAGWKFHQWELKGVPLRIEVGPKDIEKKQVTIVRRDTGEKIAVKETDVAVKVKDLLEEIQTSLFSKAKKFLDENIVKTDDFETMKVAIKAKKFAFVPWCGKEECEGWIKDKTAGAKSLNIPFNQKKPKKKCIHCDKAAEYYAYFAKSY
ncbi:MAG: proline--tRNA ligase [Nanoarchaeota archaeon]|nr:proline--tRNA ligase [Nanoarchaeota archaeon]MBU1269080.1 proline--tRNA ligase [Nanoarchaeota archaeon]MBU1604733.1 proline--tRNA ligase [Nanoarchaeota archaeon]MBU2442985.1 proline--tRNA ligase [Nanoarchaeota archaeon]